MTEQDFRKSQRIGIGTLFAIGLLETALILPGKNQAVLSCYLYWVVILVLVAFLVFGFIYNKKHIHAKFHLKSILRNLLKNSVSGNKLDILVVFFFLFHLAWIPDACFNLITENEGILYSFYQIVVFSAGLYGAMRLKPVFDKSDKHTPLVIFSGISHINARRLDSLLKPLKYKDNLSLQKWVVFIDKELKVDCPTNESIEYFYVEQRLSEIDINTLKTLDAHCKKDPKDLPEIKNSIKSLLEELIAHNKCQTKIQSIEVYDCDYDSIQQTSDTVASRVDKILQQGYKDENLLFYITPGTANFSVALALNSIRKKRWCGYVKQNGNGEYEQIDLNVFKLKDIAESFLEGLGD